MKGGDERFVSSGKIGSWLATRAPPFGVFGRRRYPKYNFYCQQQVVERVVNASLSFQLTLIQGKNAVSEIHIYVCNWMIRVIIIMSILKIVCMW